MTGLLTQMRLQAGLAGLLALLVIWELWPARPLAPPAAWADRPLAAQAGDRTADAGTWAALILARPLFRADRRPLAPRPAGVDLAVPRLTGIVITAAGRSAIFIHADGSSSALGVGSSSGAYKVQAITRDSVRLNGPDGPFTVHPQFAGATSGDGASAPPGATTGRIQDDQ